MGESAAFGPLIKLYRQRILSYLFKLCGNKDLTEDLFQETLIKIWRGLKNYKDQNKFSSWIFSIAHNTAMDKLRMNNREKDIYEISDMEFPSSASDPYSELVGSETGEIISRAVDRLSLKQREVFLLRIHGGMTFKEISEITGESLNTVLSHMNYSVKKLRKMLRFQNVE